MEIKTIYKCDVCNKEIDNLDYRIKLELRLYYFNDKVWSDGEWAKNEYDFCCSECYQKFQPKKISEVRD